MLDGGFEVWAEKVQLKLVVTVLLELAEDIIDCEHVLATCILFKCYCYRFRLKIIYVNFGKFQGIFILYSPLKIRY